MPTSRSPWKSSLQNPGLLVGVGLLAATSLILNLLHPGQLPLILLALSSSALLWLAWREFQYFRSISQAYQLAMLAAHDGFWDWNPISKKLRVGQRLLQILGYGDDFLPDTHAWLKLVHPDDRAAYNQAVAEHLKGMTPHFYCEYRVLAYDGQYRWIASRGIAVRDDHDKAYRMVGSVTDITERRLHQETMEFLARHDVLTGLPNRLLFAEQLQEAILNAREKQQKLAVLFIDLDRFKNINDTLGHRAGDEMLQAVSGRLKQQLPRSARLYRQGGDEFIVMIQALSCVDEVASIAQSIKESISQPIDNPEGNFFTSASIGISLFPDDANDGETLLRHADTAMYAAKAVGGNAIRFHTAQMDQRILLRMSLENQLHHALKENQFSLYFQPQFALSDKRLIGAEALLRWHDGSRFVPPDQFIPVAEECGLIMPIGDWVIREACRYIKTWRTEFPDMPAIAINLSPRQFWRPALSQHILMELDAHQLPCQALEVEVTESVVLDEAGDGLEQLHQLNRAGITIALDDFGTGYSSLAYLQRLPVRKLKIDRSFICALGEMEDHEKHGEALVHAIIAMAHSLSLKVVAEGVETEQQRTILQALDCDVMQGYLLGRPLPADDFYRQFLVDRNFG